MREEKEADIPGCDIMSEQVAMAVREAQTEDAGAIARILHSADWFWATELPLEQLQASAERFLKAVADVPTSTVLITERENVAVGFVAFHLYPAVRTAYEGHVSHLFVHTDTRGQGIGRQLLEPPSRKLPRMAVAGCICTSTGNARPINGSSMKRPVGKNMKPRRCSSAT